MLNLKALRKIADDARKIAIPIRTTRVTIRTRVWTGARGRGTPTVTDVPLAAYIPVRNPTSSEVATSGGQLKMGDVLVGPVTPEFAGGGYTLAQLEPAATDALTEIVYVLSGAVEGEYRRVADDTTRPFRYMLTLRRANLT